MFFVIILFKLLKKMTPLKSYTISNFVQIFSYHMLKQKSIVLKSPGSTGPKFLPIKILG